MANLFLAVTIHFIKAIYNSLFFALERNIGNNSMNYKLIIVIRYNYFFAYCVEIVKSAIYENLQNNKSLK